MLEHRHELGHLERLLRGGVPLSPANVLGTCESVVDHSIRADAPAWAVVEFFRQLSALTLAVADDRPRRAC